MDKFPDEVWVQIFHAVLNLKIGSVYKTLILVNCRVQRIGYLYWTEAKAKLANHLWTLIKMFPKLQRYWNWYDISRNPNITIQHVKDNPNFSWNLEFLSMNPNITEQIMKDNPISKIHIDGWNFSDQKNQIMFTNISESNQTWIWHKSWAANPNLTLEMIEQNFDLDTWFLSQNPNLTWNIIFQDIEPDDIDTKLDLNNQAHYADYDPKSGLWIDRPYESYRAKNWDWFYIAQNANITWKQIIKSHPDIPWEYQALSKNPNITFEIMMRHLNIYFPDWHYISKNPNLTIDIIKSIDEQNWDWEVLTRHKNITLKNILDNPNLPWEYEYLQMNPNITYPELIRTYKYLDISEWIDYNYLLKNPNLTWEIIASFTDIPASHWKVLSKNKFRR